MIGKLSVDMHIDGKTLDTYLGNIGYSACNRAGAAVVKRAQQEIIKADRIRTGRMLNSVQHSKPRAERHRVMATYVSAPTPYTNFQRFGVGPIYPKRAKVLRFQPKGSSRYVFARSTKGFKGVDFLAIAARSIRLSDFQ